MVINFKTRGISRGARKLARTPTIIKKKKRDDSVSRQGVFSKNNLFLF